MTDSKQIQHAIPNLTQSYSNLLDNDCYYIQEKERKINYDHILIIEMKETKKKDEKEGELRREIESNDVNDIYSEASKRFSSFLYFKWRT